MSAPGDRTQQLLEQVLSALVLVFVTGLAVGFLLGRL